MTIRRSSGRDDDVIVGSEFRAWLALVIPIVTIVSVALIFERKNLDVIEYFALVEDGELNVVSQAAGWLAFGIWIGRYSIPAYHVLNSSFLLAKRGGALINQAGESLKLVEVKSIKLRSSLFKKEIVATGGDGKALFQNVVFAPVPAKEIVQWIRAENYRLR